MCANKCKYAITAGFKTIKSHIRFQTDYETRYLNRIHSENMNITINNVRRWITFFFNLRTVC